MTAGLRAVRPSPPRIRNPARSPTPPNRKYTGNSSNIHSGVTSQRLMKFTTPPNTLSAMTTTAGVRDLARAAATKAPSPA